MIGTDGRIALIVDEGDRSWCSSSKTNDNRAITIECASDKTTPYAINDKVYKSLIRLLVDICQRNGIKALKWQGNKKLIGKVEQQNMTVHRWFRNKDCPGEYLYSRYGQIAEEVNAKLNGDTKIVGYTQIAGAAQATDDQMQTYLRTKNPVVAQSVFDMIPLYLLEGAAEGIRGDLAFAQSCLETGNFTFKGSAVTLNQNNFCGLGVTNNGMKGNSFDTPQNGIRAQIQHLKAYANTELLLNPVIDPRFKYVPRGCAPYVEWLGIQENPRGKGWAAGSGYGEKILTILKAIIGTQVTTTKPASLFPVVPFLVRIIIPDLNIRTSPSSADNSNLLGKYTSIGTFTIVEVSGGWGLLKSYQKKRNGWIYLRNPEYCKICF